MAKPEAAACWLGVMTHFMADLACPPHLIRETEGYYPRNPSFHKWFEEQVSRTIKVMKTRAIYVVRPQSETEEIAIDEFESKKQLINNLLETIIGERGWVKIARFQHK